jgi:sulfite oxidase
MYEYSPSPAESAVMPARLIHDAEGLNTAVWPVRSPDAVTPVSSFFTRSHAPTPLIDRATWRLEVGGLVERPISLSLEELRARFPLRHVTATLVCAGMRRNEFLALGPLPGELPWGPEPASTGSWSGISLGDLLRFVGISDRASHVELEGLDRVERQGERFGFGGSIDVSKALGEEVLLATVLNGEPIPAVHGFPLRAMVPGWIGARSVKWLGRITLLEEPSSNYFQSKAYRLQRAINPHDARDVSRGTALTELPLNSVILHPTPSDTVRAGPVRVCGWAIGAGGRALTGVELSSDGGHHWIPARILNTGERWAWSLWEAVVDLPRGRHTLVVRASDTAGALQPSNVTATWNVKGYNNNAWHRVTLDLV